jgi:hypothetical protein
MAPAGTHIEANRLSDRSTAFLDELDADLGLQGA